MSSNDYLGSGLAEFDKKFTKKSGLGGMQKCFGLIHQDYIILLSCQHQQHANKSLHSMPLISSQR
ncbi:hypothetical protein ASG36_11260 [Geodermatophilus sp. Leaf369]|nr:hypothetical protein ASG36_11260 [Geodermatophilus sp. Leaf369]